MLLTWAYSGSCNLFRVVAPNLAFDLGRDNGTEKIGIGFFYVEEIDNDEKNNYECVDYPDELDADAPMQFGRTMAVMASGLALISFVMILLPACWKPSGGVPYMKIVAGFFFVLFVITLFSLVSCCLGV